LLEKTISGALTCLIAAHKLVSAYQGGKSETSSTSKKFEVQMKYSEVLLKYQVEQKFCDIFYFACIAVQEYEKMLIFFLKDAPSNSLQSSIGLNLEQ